MGSGRAELEAAVATLERAVAGVAPEELTVDEALGWFGLFARAARFAEAGQALVARRVDAAGVAQDRGHASTAHLVATTAGVGMQRAATVVEVGRRLVEQALTDQALRRGELSLDQAGLVSEAVAAVPSAEAELLDVAGRETVRTLRDRAREVRLSAEGDREAVYARQCAARAFRHRRDRDGTVRGEFALPPDTGVAVLDTIEEATDRLYRAADRDTRRSTSHAQFAADALVGLITGTAPADRRGPTVVVHVSYDALVRGQVETGELCRLETGDDLPVRVARDLLDDAFLKGVLVDGTQVRRVRHFGRRIPAAVRTALHTEAVLRDGVVRCGTPGCDRTAGLQWHHLQPHAGGGPTTLDNLEPRCGHDHRREHRRGPPEATPP